MDLPQGWKFTPLYEHCPKCGYDLSKEFVCAEDDKHDAKPENAKGNESGWHSGKCLQEAGTSEKKNNDADNHENLVPVIKGQFGKRIIQWLLRAAG